MVDFKPYLRGKVLVLGIGNDLKGDDGAGLQLVRRIKVQSQKLEVIEAGFAPENYTGKIKQINPETLIIVDAIDFGGEPGEVRIFSEKSFGISSFSTHNTSLGTFIGFLRMGLPNLNVIIVGIQPQRVVFGEGLSPEVEKAIENLCTNLV